MGVTAADETHVSEGGDEGTCRGRGKGIGIGNDVKDMV